MPLPVDVARKSVYTLHEAAAMARHQAKVDQDIAWRVFGSTSPLDDAQRETKNEAYGQFSRYRSLQLAQQSLCVIAHLLEGLIWLGAYRYDVGIGLLENEVRLSPCAHVDITDDEPGYRDAHGAKLTIIFEDMPALRNHGRVKPGLFERLFLSEMKYAAGAEYSTEMLTIYAPLRCHVADAIEAQSQVTEPAHQLTSGLVQVY